MTVLLPSGETVPALGMGTWMMGDDPSRRAQELTALRTGLDLGLTLVDTAEMYGSGASEELVGEAITGRRDEVFLVSKVLPSNASAAGTVRACEASLRRLGTDRLDLYLLHWRGTVPFAETLEGFAALVEAGKIRHWGVSNFDLDDMRELTALPGHCQTNQILYNLTRRGPEHDLLPWQAEAGIPIMAYSPVEQGRLLGSPALATVAGRHGATAAQVALAWVLRHPHVIAIPKASTAEHVRENAAARDLRLSPEDLADLDRAFPPPAGPTPLEML
ncbi:aldo/keto reductase [Lentzea sp. NBRC 102530]|uniref:aldo/keto reductase n=1 Tax=Lentzea sp. NBRC 102530 TaxID=3032201 RepID=UPI002552408D|nr:aldo/keto reductase [Lentzea sp. NBRC 102530]